MMNNNLTKKDDRDWYPAYMQAVKDKEFYAEYMNVLSDEIKEWKDHVAALRSKNLELETTIRRLNALVDDMKETIRNRKWNEDVAVLFARNKELIAENREITAKYAKTINVLTEIGNQIFRLDDAEILLMIAKVLKENL